MLVKGAREILDPWFQISLNMGYLEMYCKLNRAWFDVLLHIGYALDGNQNVNIAFESKFNITTYNVYKYSLKTLVRNESRGEIFLRNKSLSFA